MKVSLWLTYIIIIDGDAILKRTSNCHLWTNGKLCIFFCCMDELVRLTPSSDRLTYASKARNIYMFFFSVKCGLAAIRSALPFYLLDDTYHHLFHDRVRRGHGSIPDSRHKLISSHSICKVVDDVKSEIDPRPF